MNGKRFLAVTAVCVVTGWLVFYSLSEHLPSPGSAESHVVAIHWMKTEGLSDRTIRAFKNAFPLGPCSRELEQRLEETANQKDRGMQDRVFYVFGRAAHEGDAQLAIVVEGSPRIISRHDIRVAIH